MTEDTLWVFDIETNAVDFKNPRAIDEIDVIHCVVVRGVGGRLAGTELVYADEPIPGVDVAGPVLEGLKGLEEQPYIGGHNVQQFDIPAIRKLHPWFRPRGRVFDSLAISEAAYGHDLRWMDKRRRQNGLPSAEGRLTGQHSIAAWAPRLGLNAKDDYVKRLFDGDAYAAFAHFNPEMLEYCRQDVRVNARLFEMYQRKGWLDQFWTELESRFAKVVWMMRYVGIRFDVEAGRQRYAEWAAKREAVRARLSERFGQFFVRNGVLKTAKKTLHYKDKLRGDLTEGASYQPIKLVDFNPGSADHVAMRFKAELGWEPTEFTPDGKVSVTEDILKGLPWREAQDVAEYMLLDKRCSQLGEGDTAWLKLERDGRIHARHLAAGTRTGRCSHRAPNISAVPRASSPYGEECRSLFIASDGMVMVGTDADGIELRKLGHFLHRYDGGEFGRTVVEGDPHTELQELVGFNLRDSAKTLRYAFLYGAGPGKVGAIAYADMTSEQREAFGPASEPKLVKLGKRVMTKLAQQRGLKQLLRDLKKAAQRKYLVGVDKRRLHHITARVALNTILQSSAGLVVKLAGAMAVERAEEAGYEFMKDFAPLLLVHDEMDWEVRPEIAEEVGCMQEEAMTEAAKKLGIRVPITGGHQVGESWYAIH